MSIVSLRRATEGDAERLSQIARRAKANWGYPTEWLELWREGLTIDAEAIARDWVRVAEIDGVAAGVVALREDADTLEVEHLWVDPPAMGRGLARMLVEAAMAEARRRRFSQLRIVADPNAEAFYRHLGAVRIGAVESQPAGRELPLMVLDL